jgi:hypothetical protein
MKRLLAATATLSLLAVGGPALAAKAPVHGACKAPEGATVLKAGAKAVESSFAAPVGAAGVVAAEEVGVFYLDLSGTPTSTRGKITLTLSWDNPVTDYDLVVNGVNELSTDNPETATAKASHCKPVQVGVEVFSGVPAEQLTLAAKGS